MLEDGDGEYAVPVLQGDASPKGQSPLEPHDCRRAAVYMGT
ncbi:MAG: hypothetical protein PHD32_06800 [Eubacteriales bacterium]|nr:hypothetical protein [Eubacteriales bacterium]